MRVFLSSTALVLCLILAPVICAGAAGTGSVTAGDPAMNIPGLGDMTEEDIAQLGEFTQELINEYPIAGDESVVSVIREPAAFMSYDPASRRYRYTFPDGEWVECNMPQGAFCRGSVEFTTSENVTSLSVLRDGMVSMVNAPYRESGDYVVTFWDLNVEGDMNTAYRYDYVFTIYSEYRMNVSCINAPLGMEIEEMTLDGQNLDVTGSRNVLLKQDGDYRIVFTGDGAEFEMVFTRDTTPPVLEISPEYIYHTIYDEYPTYSVPDRESHVRVRRNYVDENLPVGELLLNGYYELKVSDDVGNERTYSFTVKAPLPLFSPWFLAVPALFIVACAIISIHTRRNMQVR